MKVFPFVSGYFFGVTSTLPCSPGFLSSGAAGFSPSGFLSVLSLSLGFTSAPPFPFPGFWGLSGAGVAPLAFGSTSFS